MSSSELPSRLEDILEAIAVIGAYTTGKTLDDYATERMLRDAVERNVERISEAPRHIPRSIKAKHPEIPWRKVAGRRNTQTPATDMAPTSDDVSAPPRGRYSSSNETAVLVAFAWQRSSHAFR